MLKLIFIKNVSFLIFHLFALSLKNKIHLFLNLINEFIYT
jgi:hypothetical protein